MNDFTQRSAPAYQVWQDKFHVLRSLALLGMTTKGLVQ